MTEPDEALRIVLDRCAARGESSYATFCAVLAGYAESDYRVGARQLMLDGVHYTQGVFQQSDRSTDGVRWWPGDLSDIGHTADLFLDAFRGATGDPVRDCWAVQHWAAPDPAADPTGFAASAETINYTDRLAAVTRIIIEGKLP